MADLGEDGVLALILPRLPRGGSTLLGPGDDAAVLTAADGRTVVSTDVLVDGRHFRRAWSTGTDVGHRAAMQNLADIAAMGARPTALVVALVCPLDLPVSWLLGLADGLAAACGPRIGVVGGDLSAGEELAVSVTVLGDLDGAEPVLRSGARVGDVVAHAGVRGRSAAGLDALLAGRDEDLPEVVEGYRRPVCPIEAGPAAARAGATAMLDVSDGLLRDAGRIARASGVTLDLDDPERSFLPDLAALAEAERVLGGDARAWVLTGGEDHGLLATFPPGTDLPAPFRAVGRVVRVVEGTPVLVAGSPPHGALGWDHFSR
ncbi:thiamine-phosphate kinase [Actinotalea sp.]|uniref:thiamine-phosphate kinase n=1 Tax=Actinotalea sp. TaxID=1872145 RepID=UPI0035696A77